MEPGIYPRIWKKRNKNDKTKAESKKK